MANKRNRNRQTVNRHSQANGVAQANAAATNAAKESADNLALAVEWICRAEFGPSLAYLMAGYYVFLYVSGALRKERERTGGGGNLSATRAAAKKIAEGKFLEATGNNGTGPQALPDMDVLIKTYSAYSLLSGQQEPSASTCEAPWSGFRDLGRLVYRKDAESEGWAFAEAVDVAKARAVFTDWLLTRPRVKVSELVASVSSLLGLAPKAPAATKPATTPATPVVTVVPVATGETPATLAPDPRETEEERIARCAGVPAIIPAPATSPNAVTTPPADVPPVAPGPDAGAGELAKHQDAIAEWDARRKAAQDNPAAPAVAKEEAKPAPTEAPEVNPNFAPGGEVEDEEEATEDVEPDAQEEAPTSDLPRPVGRKPGERKADVNAIAFDGKPENVAEQFLEVLLSYDDAKDGHAVMTSLGRMFAHESMEKSNLLASLLEAYCEASEDVDTLQGIAELAGIKADSLTDARQPAVAAVA